LCLAKGGLNNSGSFGTKPILVAKKRKQLEDRLMEMNIKLQEKDKLIGTGIIYA